MKSRLSSVQRTLRQLRQEGCICGIVEKFNPHVGKFGMRQDLFGIFDLIVIYPKNICGIQACTSYFKAHKKKILYSEIAPEWIKAGGRIELWGWRKVKKVRGGVQMVWRPRKYTFSLNDFGREYVWTTDKTLEKTEPEWPRE